MTEYVSVSSESVNPSWQLYSNDNERETPFQAVPSKKKAQQVKKVTPKVITSQGKDDSVWAREYVLVSSVIFFLTIVQQRQWERKPFSACSK